MDRKARLNRLKGVVVAMQSAIDALEAEAEDLLPEIKRGFVFDWVHNFPEETADDLMQRHGLEE